jgi:hypothetical protein
MFYLDVSNVDLGVAHVAMAIHACFKRMFQVFLYFRRMLQMFHLDVSKVDMVLHMWLWLYTHVSSVSSTSDVAASVSFGCFKSRSRGSTCC